MKVTILNSVTMLNNESWSNVYSRHDVNKSFNSILNSFFICFESCFSMHRTTKHLVNNSWIT
jgi:hypothetical protein